MRVAVLLLLTLAGCDALSDSDPEWARVGAAATFDYTPGADSLSVLGLGGEPPFSRAASTPRAVTMRVVAADRGDYTDRRIRWHDVGASGQPSRFRYEARLPLADERVGVDEDGLTGTVVHDCPDIGLRTTSAAGPLTFLRVPRAAPRALEVWSDCSRSPLYYRAVRVETVTVPAGTFEAVVIEGPAHPDGSGAVGIEWWSWEAGLVRYDALRYDGVLQGRFERSSGG